MTIAVRPEVDIQPEITTTIKPSEAIRLGRLSVPNGLPGVVYSSNAYGVDGPVACTLGAMAIGYGVDPLNSGKVSYYWPEAFRDQCHSQIAPLCDCFFGTVSPMAFMAHTFDRHVMGAILPSLTEQDIIDHLAAYGL